MTFSTVRQVADVEEESSQLLNFINPLSTLVLEPPQRFAVVRVEHDDTRVRHQLRSDISHLQRDERSLDGRATFGEGEGGRGYPVRLRFDLSNLPLFFRDLHINCLLSINNQSQRLRLKLVRLSNVRHIPVRRSYTNMHSNTREKAGRGRRDD